MRGLRASCPLVVVVGLFLVGGVARPATARLVFTRTTLPKQVFVVQNAATKALPTATHNSGSGSIEYTPSRSGDSDDALPTGLRFETTSAGVPQITGTLTSRAEEMPSNPAGLVACLLLSHHERAAH